MTHGKVFIIAPVFNESGNIAELLARLDEVLAGESYEFHIVLVNDGSDDETTALLNGLLAGRTRTTVLHLSRNFGHQAALSAGLEEACRHGADAAISMDSDLQHPPRLLPEFLRFWELGYDVVYSIREDTGRTGFMKRVTSAVFYKVVAFLSEGSVPRGAADFRLLGRGPLEAITALPERTRFLRGLTTWIGFRQVGFHYVPEPRFSGRTKYTLAKMYHLAIDGIVSMTTLPLKAVLGLGLSVSFLAMCYLVYVVIAHFVPKYTVPGWSSVIVSVLLLGGMNLTVLGVLGLYLAKIFDEVKGRPLYLVRERREAGDAARDEGPPCQP